MTIIGKVNKKIAISVFLCVAIFTILCVFVDNAIASEGSDLPWNTGLEKLVNVFSGKTALFVTAVGIFALAGMAIFGGDLGMVGKGLMMTVIAGSILGGLMTVANYFVQSGYLI